MKRRLSETLEMALTVDPNLAVITDNMVAEWGSVQYPQLSVLLVHLKYLAMLHQNHHWTTKGDPFYGDHLLFSRLYDAVADEIDSVAEKAVGLGSTANVDLTLQTSQVMKLINGYSMQSTIPQGSELAKKSHNAEMTFLKVTERLVESLRESGLLTRGLDNLIAGIEDTHESHCYLLKQKVI